MYKLYSVHGNDLLIRPKSLMPSSSSAWPWFVVRWLECSLMTAHLPCLDVSEGGFDRTLLLLVHRTAQGPHVPVVHALVPCSLSAHGPSLSSIFSAFSPSCGTTAFLLKCKAVLRSLLHVRYKTSFLFPWDRKLHVRWNNQVSMTRVSYTTKPDPIIKFPRNGNKTQISLALCK